MTRLLTLLFVLCNIQSAYAQDGNSTIPQGATLLNISATEETQIAQDMLVSNLRIEKRLANPVELQQEVNTAMTKALEILKEYKDIDVSTEQYYAYEYYNNENGVEQKLWQATQGLSLKSKSSEKILEATGKLQNLGFLMNGLSFMLSPEKYEEVRESMLETALAKLEKRAKRVGTALDKPNVDMWEVNVDAAPSMSTPVPMMMARGADMAVASSMEMKSAGPVAQPGKDVVSMTVSAKVLLTP